MSMDVNSAGGGATAEQMTKAGQDIAQWAKTSDLKGGETSLYRQLAADGIAAPEQNGPMGNYIHALENLKAKNTDFTSNDGWSNAFTNAVDAGKNAGIDTHNLYEAAENASHNADETQAPAKDQAAGAQGTQTPDPTTNTPVTNSAPQDTSAGKKATQNFISDAYPFNFKKISSDEAKEFGKKYWDDYSKVCKDIREGRDNPDNVNALTADNKKWDHLAKSSRKEVQAAMEQGS